MLREQNFEKLYSLKLHGMAQSFEQQLTNPNSATLGFEEHFGMLVEDQWLSVGKPYNPEFLSIIH